MDRIRSYSNHSYSNHSYSNYLAANSRRLIPAIVVLLAGVAISAQQAARSAPPPTITVAVDATEATRKILHAKLTIPVSPGPVTLYYPKWIPGEHGPTGPIQDLAGLKFTGGGRTLNWRRDLVDMYEIHVDVPAISPRISTLEVSLDYLSPTEGLFSSGASTTEKLAVLSWNTVLLYPKGWTSDQIMVKPSLRLPPGWQFGTALDATKQGDEVEFAGVSLATLVDSPVLAGLYFKKIDLGAIENGAKGANGANGANGAGSVRHTLNIAADGVAALDAKPEIVQHFKNLVMETGALFGARHYRHYDFLLTLSDHTAHFGLEHHESSDDRIAEKGITDPDVIIESSGMLPHEMTHSWNGKYRRPAGLATSDYQQPMKGDLLWVYEGMTMYWGVVLTARSGELTPELLRDQLAHTAAYLDHWPGRSWRSLQDTADAAQVLYAAPISWSSWRRSVDFYDEGTLLWLEVDTLIRQQTGGAKSLDDFCQLFFGAQSGPPRVVPYTFEDIVAALGKVAPYDWRTLLRRRLDATGSLHAPLAGIENAGWKLVYSEQMSPYMQAVEASTKVTAEWYSIGARVNSQAVLVDTVRGMAAENAGLAPGMKLVAVNGQPYAPDVLRHAISAAKSSTEPIDIYVQNGEYFRSFKLDYHGGLRQPHLERDSSRPDLLSLILKPRTR